MMQIYIPTRGRASAQTTLLSLPASLKARTTLVLDHGQSDYYRLKRFDEQGTQLWELPAEVKGIAAVRQYIMDHSSHRYIVMLDDDLRFYTKREPDRKIIGATPVQITAMFAQLENWLLEGVVHCSITPRFIGWAYKESCREVWRMMHVLAYDREAVAAAGCRFTKDVDNSFSMDDFHMTIQLLKAGHKNRIDLINCTSPKPSNARGGASEWRTLQSHNASAARLKEIHGDGVRVSEKQGWHGMDGIRYDVTVQWRKIYESSGADVSTLLGD